MKAVISRGLPLLLRHLRASRIRLVQMSGLAVMVWGLTLYSQSLGAIVGGAVVVVLAEMADRSSS